MVKKLFGLFLVVFLSIIPSPEGFWDFIPRARINKRITGADLDTADRWKVAGTDLGIPYVLENGAIGFLFGDTFNTARPEDEHNDWRSPVMLRSHSEPSKDSVIWDNAAGVWGDGRAPAIMDKEEDQEVTIIPNDGISFNETGRQIISFMSIRRWSTPQQSEPNNSGWSTRYAGLAYSDDGNHFIRHPQMMWVNNGENSDPFQMWTMQRDGDWVYIFSVRAGRQNGPMMLQRVRWDRMFWKNEYQCWGRGGRNRQWNWGNPCTSIIPEGKFGEPSVRLLRDGSWAMAYLNLDSVAIVTRRASAPNGAWSGERTQVTHQQESCLYGGFIHPWSTGGEFDLHMMVSTWKGEQHCGTKPTTQYHVSHYEGTLN